MKSVRKTLISVVLGIAGLGLVSRLFYKASLDSGDFLVYWRAAHAWLTGTAFPYGVIDPTIPGFVFKYPPWILPLFTPIGVLGERTAKAVWAILELGALVYSIRRVISFGVRKEIAVFAALCMWWIWQEQFWSGQITLFMLAAAVWIAPMGKERSFPQAFVAYLFTAKVFSVITLFGKWRELIRPRTLAQGAGLVILPTLLVLFVLRLHDATHSIGMVELFQRFFASANSGGVSLGANVIRGPINHGFTAAILRGMQIDSANSTYDLVVPIILAALLGSAWGFYSRALRPVDSWIGWLALGAIIHPLAWDHTFVLVFPVCALALERTLQSRQYALLALSFLGLACVGLAVPNLIGTEWVKPLDFIGTKSWGVVFCGIALVLNSRKEPTNRHSKEIPVPGL